MITRILEKELNTRLFKGSILILYGARQTGKTTVIRQLLTQHQGLYFNGDEPDVRVLFNNRTSTELKQIVGDAKLVVIDEAQRIENIGLTLKLLHDQFPEIQLIATGSSSFELADRIKEPLTGRKFEFLLPPLSLEELDKHQGRIDTDRKLSHYAVYGLYPQPATLPMGAAKERLLELSSSYLYQDVLLMGGIRFPEKLEKLTRALALQIGQEVSFPELGGLIGLDKNTVETYVTILEKAFVLFRLPPFSRNLRTELKKRQKIYFWDTGIRNAILNAFQPLETRSDTGVLWENFIISERMKFLKNHLSANPSYFWRTHQQQEVDYVEDRQGILLAAEIKRNARKGKIPKTFTQTYADSKTCIIDQKNWRDFVYISP